MKANKFVKHHGMDAAIKFSKMIGVRTVCNCPVEDLKRLVKSWELVESFGGLDLAKECLGQLPNKHQSYTLTRDDPGVTTQSFKLEQAIADVESCQ